ncbi:MmgE/PrpD family protein [Variovorax paradoxus]|uniref:MmgE/PrpD family protein n=1 Tax=Variovorax paradoxus TaxID=34073 RepID=UPI0029C6A58E|nr:MmgE/PrpD family protein [Variovorax paradoxus]WPH24007.1 MmgE/PrpD family protein [Variovorax paradoxus]
MNPTPISTALPESALVAHLFHQASQPLTVATRARLAQALLDWFTAGWSAQDMSAAATLRELGQALMPGAGEAAMFGGNSSRTTPLAAGFVNAGIAHLREIDDAHRAAMLHPGVVAITPVLALASSCGLTRERAARAVVAGYEVALRLGEALGARHAGLFHATATAGAVGAAAAAGMAMGLDAPRLHHALGIAATQAAGLWQLVDDDAHESKSLHPAFAVRNGMTAAYAARAGLPGARAFFTGRRGLYAALAGEGPLAAVDGALEAPERLHTTTIKAWPACAMLFTPLDATRALIEEHRIGAADVQAMEIEIFPHALKIAGVQWPAKPAEASFCLRYVLAVLLEKEGVLGIADTEAPDLDSPSLHALAARMQVVPNEAFQQAFPQRRPSRVTIRLRDGRQISAYRDLRRGDPEDPYTWEGLQQRMRTFVPAMDDAQAAALATWCEGFTDAAQDALPCAPAGALFGASRLASRSPHRNPQRPPACP